MSTDRPELQESTVRIHPFLPSTLTGTHPCSDFRPVTKSVPCLTHPNCSPTGYGRASPTSLSLLSQRKCESEIWRLLLRVWELLGKRLKKASWPAFFVASSTNLLHQAAKRPRNLVCLFVFFHVPEFRSEDKVFQSCPTL